MTDDEYRDLLQQAHDMEGHWPLNLARLAERKALERAIEIITEPVGLECCGHPEFDMGYVCCGNGEPAFRTIDEAVKEIRALLDAQSKDTEGA